MRFTSCVLAIALVACASQPPPPPVTRQVKIDASNVEAVQRAGYKLVNKDGKRLYCRTDPITGSRIQTRTTCMTEEELDQQAEATREAMERIQMHTAIPYGK
jgi:hypothetical protein